MALKMHRHGLPMRAPSLATRATETDRLRGGAWQSLREQVLRRDNGVCVLCCAAVATEVDHVVPLASGGSNAVTNLQSVCGPCHAAKSRAQAAGLATGERMRYGGW